MKGDVLAEFESPQDLVQAIQRLRHLGCDDLDVFSPYPLKEAERALGLRRSRLSWLVLLSGVVGGSAAYGVQLWTNGIDYPLIVGGFNPHSPPPFVPITFETTVLFAAFAAFLGLLALLGLPQWWHPVFDIDGFERASIDRFFLLVSGIDLQDAEMHINLELMRHRALRVIALGTK